MKVADQVTHRLTKMAKKNVSIVDLMIIMLCGSVIDWGNWQGSPNYEEQTIIGGEHPTPNKTSGPSQITLILQMFFKRSNSVS